MGGTNKFGKNIGHHNKKLDQISNHVHFIWDFPKSQINEYNDRGSKSKHRKNASLKRDWTTSLDIDN